MNKLIEFIGNNYAWFLTISIILLFALIGYIYDSRHNKLKNKDNDEDIKDEKEVIKEDIEVIENDSHEDIDDKNNDHISEEQ